MPLTVVIEPDAIVAVLDRVIAADPVRATILGTMRNALEPGAAWLAADGDPASAASVAVRSTTLYPVTLVGPWSQRERLAGLLAGLPDVAGLGGEQALVADLVARLGTPVARQVENRLFRVDELVGPTGVAGSWRVAAPNDRALVRDWVFRFNQEVGEDVPRSACDVAADRVVDAGQSPLWTLDGDPVALAARRQVVAGSARIGPVYTPPASRGHGYASAAVAAAARSIQDEGAVPTLFTDLANPTSNKIYRALGFAPVEDRVQVFFAP